MKFFGFFTFLISLLPLANAWTVHKYLKTVQACSTQYCGGPRPLRVTSATKTIHKTTKATVKTTPTHTFYATLPTKTLTLVTTLYSSTTLTLTHTFGDASQIITTIYIPTTITVLATTITVGPTTVPTPSGFLNVWDDPDNKLTTNLKRANPVYPTAVRCTKTIQTLYKYTITAKPRRTTVTRYKKTATVSRTKVLPFIASTIWRYATTTRTYTLSITRTSTSTHTIPGTTVSAWYTGYAACRDKNFADGPPNRNIKIAYIPGDIHVDGPTDPSACCMACHARVNAEGVHNCLGSWYWRRSLEQGEVEHFCILRLTNVCSFNNHSLFYPGTDRDLEGFISNGPCGRWKPGLA